MMVKHCVHMPSGSLALPQHWYFPAMWLGIFDANWVAGLWMREALWSMTSRRTKPLYSACRTGKAENSWGVFISMWSGQTVRLTGTWAMLAFQAVLQRASVDIPSLTLGPGGWERPQGSACGVAGRCTRVSVGSVNNSELSESKQEITLVLCHDR